ncbi:MAG: carboxylesterase/lipase family protein [Deltaproteobacteria bacterium]|nr:carboxylesterase/lipase family protein [Deltaproteobacteria bacterium]MBW2418009.1 carboxylesterase/lipase family protein [Deltaproteobacteria bacterium]
MTITVDTPGGKLEGREQDGVQVFRGIPYALPPVGALRFRAPVPTEPWYGSRPALDFGPSAPQVGPISRLVRTMIGVGGSTQSQDCLYLNVWTPKAPDPSHAKRRPVMVWIHGGAFILGSGSSGIYSGARLAQRGDVVVVTINYRLGALGFLTWDSLCGEVDRPPANVGLLDQIAALEWVRDNIEAFGGDPENVTVFGESAGGMSVGTLLGTPRARGLFHKALLQSGAGHNCSSPERADKISQQFVSELKLDSPSPEKLGALPVGEIMRAQAITSAKIGLVEGTLAWQPSVDAKLIPEQPLVAIAGGLSADIPTLVGSNRDEWKLFMTGDRAARDLSEAGLAERIRRALPGKNEEGEAVADAAIEAYQRVNGPRGSEPAERWTAFQSDRVFHYPATRIADLQSRHQAQTFSYLFEWAPALLGGRIGACHGVELPFVFGSIRAPLIRATLGAGRTAQRLCHRVQDAWLAFARTGSPDHSSLPVWPSYSEERRLTMALAGESKLREDPHAPARRFWLPVMGDEPQERHFVRPRGDV